MEVRMSSFKVGSKVKVPRLNWSNAEIVEVIPALQDEKTDALPPYYVRPDGFPNRQYHVKNLENNKTEWVVSSEMILVA